MNRLAFDVVGLPSPKGSVTRMPAGGYVHGRSAAQRERQSSWATAVTDAAVAAINRAQWATLTGPVGVSIQFLMPVVASDRYRTRHTTMPDLDKLVRHCFDSLVHAGVMADDALVCEVSASKSYTRDGRTGARITVVDMAESEALNRADLKAAAARERRQA